tara:strand:- start:9197 stop:10288 length:1092 start_codon:yes stop_codon:yes gene_type:complete
MNIQNKIPIYKPFLGVEETNLVSECMNSTWISSQGEFIEKFEQGVQNYVGIDHAITCSNGTVAIHLAMLALDIKEGDEVITTNFTYVASSNSILYMGAKPVFVDINPATWNIDVSKIEEKITTNTKAILYTNIFGAIADYDALKRIADKYSLFLVEDAAESLGSSYKGRMSGSLGDISTFSFFGNKTITTGEGGMVLTSNPKFAKKIRQLKNQGNSETVRYFHDVLGYNYRMTNIQAAIGVAQLNKIERILELKRNIHQVYREGLKGLVGFQKIEEGSTSSYWMCSIFFKSSQEKNIIVKALNDENIETRPFFVPINELPFYKKENDYPVTEEVSALGLNLPSYPELTKEELNRIILIIKKNI